MNEKRFRVLNFGLSLVIGLSNLLLALLLLFFCLVPIISWLLLILYTVSNEFLVALLTLVLWVWAVCSAVILLLVATSCLRHRKWDLFLQFLPFIVGAVLSLLMYLAGGWKTITAPLGWF